MEKDGLKETHIQKRQKTEDTTPLATLLDLDSLDCPLCLEPLTTPVFQCVNGHITCHLCCPNLNNKCPSCNLEIGNIRCRAIENIIESVIVPCRNAKLGCTKTLPYGKEGNHETEYCKFAICFCPECKYSGCYSDVYFHYLASHSFDSFFTFGEPSTVRMHTDDKILVRMTLTKPMLFAVQCFWEPNGTYVTVNCIAPVAPEVEKFSYRISYSFHGHTHIHQVADMKRIVEVSSQIPDEKNFMFISKGLLDGEILEMELSISEVEPEGGSSSQVAEPSQE